ENENLKVEIQRLQDSNAELEKLLVASKSEINELQEKISLQKKETEAKLQNYKEKLKKCYSEIDNLKVKRKEELEDLSSLEADVSVKEKTQSEQKTGEEELTDKENKNNNKNEKLTVEIQKLQDSNAELEKSLVASTREIDELQLQKKEIEAEVQTLKLNASYLQNETESKDDSLVSLDMLLSLKAEDWLALQEETVARLEAEAATPES
uniref:Uncharacterized protein n=1 Tax=Amphimedon queenslandica TaxID=400682 RepID=A0A1X7SGL4_AMPQE